jgi:uncharacterized protein YecT (DUF1311 family)
VEGLGFFSRLGLIALFLGIQSPALLAQSEGHLRAQAKNAEDELNRTYQQLMSALPPPARAQLRVAERAWLEFTTLNSAAFGATAQIRGLPPAALQQWEIMEVRSRTGQLQMAALKFNATGRTVASDFRNADVALNAVYQRCLAALSPPEVTLLRAAQRAWVAFRSASGGFDARIPLAITANRSAQLQGFYLQVNPRGVGAAQTAPSAPPAEDQKIDPTIPDPYERVRK